jgi:arylsulfatase A-like enzyme
MMNYFLMMKYLKLLPFLLLFCLQCLAQKKPKNIVVMLVDDMGWMDLSCQGSKFYETPNIDALAKDGVNFKRGYAACPVCSPSRAAIMTGKYPTKTGITDWIDSRDPAWDRNTRLMPAKNKLKIEPSETTIAELLKTAGYTTFFSGKWHLGDEGFYPENNGFDINKGGYSGGHPASYFAPYKNPRLPDGPTGEYLPERLANETSQFIKNSSPDKPFFAYHSFYLVHTPLQAKAELEAKYLAKRETLELKDDKAKIGEDVFHKQPFREVRTVQSHAKYAAMVEALDNAVGQIVKALKDKGLYENTLVIFTSDNGGLSTAEGSPTSNMPLRGGKGYMYEGGIRVPFIAKIPNYKNNNTESNIAVSGVDLYPTIAAFAGVKLPINNNIDGKNIMTLLNQKKDSGRTLFWHYPHYGNQGGGPASCIMENDMKLIYWYDSKKYELFNLGNDLGENNDLVNVEPQKFQALKGKLDKWLKETNAKFPTVNVNYK